MKEKTLNERKKFHSLVKPTSAIMSCPLAFIYLFILYYKVNRIHRVLMKGAFQQLSRFMLKEIYVRSPPIIPSFLR